MLNMATIENALYAWVFGVTALPTIFHNPDAERPTTAYSIIHIVQSTPMGVADRSDTLNGVDDSDDVDHSNLEDLFVSINTYYAGAFQLATKLKDSLARVTVTDALYAAGLGYIRATAVKELDEEINKKWEDRGQFDCFFYVRSLDEENIEAIRKIEITNKLDDSTVIIEHP